MALARLAPSVRQFENLETLCLDKLARWTSLLHKLAAGKPLLRHCASRGSLLALEDATDLAAFQTLLQLLDTLDLGASPVLLHLLHLHAYGY